jgi:hypothetical protein
LAQIRKCVNASLTACRERPESAQQPVAPCQVRRALASTAQHDQLLLEQEIFDDDRSHAPGATELRPHDGQVQQGEQEVCHARVSVGQTSGAAQPRSILDSERKLAIRDPQGFKSGDTHKGPSSCLSTAEDPISFLLSQSVQLRGDTMFSLVRIVTFVLVLVGIATLLGRIGRAQEPSRRHRTALNFLEEKARAARSDNPQAVRAYIDEIFDRSLFSGAAESIRDRVYRNELAYRKGTLGAIAETTFVGGLNDQVRTMNSPTFSPQAYMRTTEGQVRLFRESLRFFVPNLGMMHGEAPVTTHATPQMSPAEVALISVQLTQQKLLTPEYQVEPEEWERNALARRAQADQHSQKSTAPTLVATTASEFLVSGHASLNQSLKDESGTLVAKVHDFMDKLGFQR